MKHKDLEEDEEEDFDEDEDIEETAEKFKKEKDREEKGRPKKQEAEQEKETEGKKGIWEAVQQPAFIGYRNRETKEVISADEVLVKILNLLEEK